MDSKSGVIGFFDILGYQSIIENNKIQVVANIIENILLQLPENIKIAIIDKMSGDITPYVLQDQKGLSSLIISDSILLFMPFKPDAPCIDPTWPLFLGHASLLLRAAFDKGIPLRGAIDFGEYFIKENCFAGKPIVNAYRLANTLEFSGCVLTERAGNAVSKYYQEGPEGAQASFSNLVFSYLCPCKGGEEKRLLLLNWIQPFSDWGKIPDDLRDYVIWSFHAHQKDVKKDVLSKIENTEMITRYSLRNIANLV